MNNFFTRCELGDAWLFRKKQNIMAIPRSADGDLRQQDPRSDHIVIRAAILPRSDAQKEL